LAENPHRRVLRTQVQAALLDNVLGKNIDTTDQMEEELLDERLPILMSSAPKVSTVKSEQAVCPSLCKVEALLDRVELERRQGCRRGHSHIL
jgi:hypothetical protein